MMKSAFIVCYRPVIFILGGESLVKSSEGRPTASLRGTAASQTKSGKINEI